MFQETQRILEKKIFKKESDFLKLSVEMREKRDDITHLKTREVSLIDKSDTLERGQIINSCEFNICNYDINFRFGIFKR